MNQNAKRNLQRASGRRCGFLDASILGEKRKPPTRQLERVTSIKRSFAK